MLFGAPNGGLHYPPLPEMVKDRANRALIESILLTNAGETPPYLSKLNETIQAAMDYWEKQNGKKPTSILVCYSERRETPLPKVRDRSFSSWKFKMFL